jgi:effector-binding domain-containing protein
MSSQIEATIRSVDTHTAAFIAMKGPYRLIEGTVRKMIAVTMETGYTITGMPVGVFTDMPGQAPKDEQLWEIRFPINSSAVPGTVDEHGMGVKKVKAFQFACAVHTGPLTEIRRTTDGLVSWIEENGYAIAGPLEEVYLTDPADAAPEDLVTEVGFPVTQISST